MAREGFLIQHLSFIAILLLFGYCFRFEEIGVEKLEKEAQDFRQLAESVLQTGFLLLQRILQDMDPEWILPSPGAVIGAPPGELRDVPEEWRSLFWKVFTTLGGEWLSCRTALDQLLPVASPELTPGRKSEDDIFFLDDLESKGVEEAGIRRAVEKALQEEAGWRSRAAASSAARILRLLPSLLGMFFFVSSPAEVEKQDASSQSRMTAEDPKLETQRMTAVDLQVFQILDPGLEEIQDCFRNWRRVLIRDPTKKHSLLWLVGLLLRLVHPSSVRPDQDGRIFRLPPFLSSLDVIGHVIPALLNILRQVEEDNKILALFILRCLIRSCVVIPPTLSDNRDGDDRDDDDDDDDGISEQQQEIYRATVQRARELFEWSEVPLFGALKLSMLQRDSPNQIALGLDVFVALGLVLYPEHRSLFSAALEQDEFLGLGKKMKKGGNGGQSQRGLWGVEVPRDLDVGDLAGLQRSQLALALDELIREWEFMALTPASSGVSIRPMLRRWLVSPLSSIDICVFFFFFFFSCSDHFLISISHARCCGGLSWVGQVTV